MRSILIFNPGSGLSLLAENRQTPEESETAILTALRAVGIEPEVWHTTPEEYGHGLATRAAQEGAELVIAAGGDGTLHAVASGLIGTRSILGILPLGTMNNIARSLEIPTNLEQACAIIAQGTTWQVDAGVVNGKTFLEVAGIGLEAALFPAAENVKKLGLLSTIRGVIEGLYTLFVFKPAHFRASFDGRRSRRFHAIQISVCNSPYYGAHFHIAPRASMNDGLLDVLIYKNFSKLAYLRHAISISQGRRILKPRVKQFKVKTLTISSEEPVVVHADGMQQGYTPASINVIHKALNVRVPQHITGKHTSKARTRKRRHKTDHKEDITHVR